MKINEKLGKFIKPLAIIAGLGVSIISIFLCLYLIVLPKLVQSQKVHNFIDKTVYEYTGANIVIKSPTLKTSLSPDVTFYVDDFQIVKKSKPIFVLNNLNTEFSFRKILCKNFKVKTLGADYIFADVNGLLSLMPESSKQEEQKCDWSVDLYDSLLYVKNVKIIYDIDKNTHFNTLAKNIEITNSKGKESLVHFDVKATLSKGLHKINISFKDDNKIYIKKKNLYIDDAKLLFNNSSMNIKSKINQKHQNVEVSSKNFMLENIVDLINSNILIPNGSELLSYFKDIKGRFDFRINYKDNDLSGKVNLNRLSLILIPINNVPVIINKGAIGITSKDITLKGFEGYYGTRKINSLKFGGTIKDYTKTLDTNIIGDAVVTNDFAKYYLTPMVGYPLGIEGKADTKLMLKSLNGVIDITWLFKISPNDNLLIGGEPLSKYKMERVLASEFHIDKNIMDIKNLGYFVTVPNNTKYNKRQILNLTGKIDFSKGVDFKEMGFNISEPLPSEFLNVIIRQAIFKGGTVVGKMKAIDGKKGVKLFGDIKLSKIRVPSQRIYLENGTLSTDFNKINISSNGRYRKTKFNLSGNFVNNIAFPIIVNDINLSLDKIDVEKLLHSFNNQGNKTTTTTSTELSDDDDTQTFDISNIIIKKCTFGLKEGSYKDIKFGNINANMTLDEKSELELDSNRFDFAEGHSSCHVCCHIKDHDYHVRLGVKDINSDIIATTLLNLKKEISGKASGIIDIHTDDSLKLNGDMKFDIKNGTIGKIGLIEYVLKFASLFRNPFTMISPATIVDLVNIPQGDFDKITGTLHIKNNVIEQIKIKSTASQLSAYIAGRYDLEKRDASLRIYTKFATKQNGIYGFLRYFSLNSLALKLPKGGSRNDSNYYASELEELPKIDVPDKDCQIFLTKVEGDVERNNFLSSLKKIK